MSSKLFVVVLLVVMAAMVAACDKSPTAPTPPIVVVPPDAYSVPLPGGGGEFKWWISDINPPRGSRLNVGQVWSIRTSCDGPDGYTYYMQKEFTSGPGASDSIDASGHGQYNALRKSGWTDGCSGGRSSSGHGGTVISRTPDLPYIRFAVWVAPGNGLDRQVDRPAREPDVVVYERIGWRRPE